MAHVGIPGIDALTLSSALAWVPVSERLPCRVVRRSWASAVERGPARIAWLKFVGEDIVAESSGSSLVSCYSHHRFLAGGRASDLCRGPPTKCGEMGTPGRIAATTPAVALADGTAVALVDTASAVAAPDVSLSVYNMSSMLPIGTVPIKRLRHGQSIQRPLRVRAFQGLHAGAMNAAQAKGCIAAIERLVVVFSWRLGLGDVSALELLDSRADEIRWCENSKEVLSGVSFVGSSLKVVSVLLEGLREGPVVEIYEKGVGANSGYVLRQTIAIPVGKPSSAPSSSALRGGALYDGLALWAVAGSRTIQYVTLPRTQSKESEDEETENLTTCKGLGKTSSTNGFGIAAIFARAKQASKRCKLRVDDGGGAGLDLEACRWGYVVEEVASNPGQSDLFAGDCIIAIAGQSLHDLGDEDLVHWRFGRNFANGVEITVIPADQARAFLAAEDTPLAKVATDPAPQSSSMSVDEPAKPELLEVRALDVAGRLEAWCVDVSRDSARILAVADNCLYMAKVYTDGGSTVTKLVNGVARTPWKRPIVKVELLHASSDVVLLGLAGAVLLWRVPGLVTSIGPSQQKEPELLLGVSMPPRCSLAGMCCGVLPGIDPFGWIAVELGGMCMDSSSSLEMWHFFKGRQRPPLRLPMVQSWNNSGVAVDTVAAAVRPTTGLEDWAE